MKKKIFDICIFNIDNYLEKRNVFYIFQKNYELFEKYKIQNKNIDINWHIIDNAKIKEIAENFNLKYTKRQFAKGRIDTDEIKFFLSTQFDNYITFPADMLFLEKNLFDGSLNNLFDENNQIFCYRAGESKDSLLIVNPNNIIKSTDKNSKFIEFILEYFSNYFDTKKSNFCFFDENDLFKKYNISTEQIFTKKEILDFKLISGLSRLYISQSVIKRFYNEYKKNLPIELKNFKCIFFTDNSYPLISEKKVGFTFALVDFNLTSTIGFNFLNPIKNGIEIFQDFYRNFFNNSIISEIVKETIESLENDETPYIDVSNYSYLGYLKELLKRLYEYNGNHKFNLYSAINFENTEVNLETFGNFWQDYCYENKDNPDEFIPLPYLNLDDAVQKLCW